MNTLINKISQHCMRPLPDRMFTWINLAALGYYTLGAATYGAGFALNFPNFPLNNAGAVSTKLPNPSRAVTVINPCGYKNLIYNGTTTTGLYYYGRVWAVKGTFHVQPQAAGDALTAAIAPVIGTGNSYTGTSTCMQGPFAKVATCTSGSNAKDCVLSFNYSLPKIFGVPPKDYAGGVITGSGNSFGDGSAPALLAFANIWLSTLDQANTTANIGWVLKLQYLVEFWSSTDTALIDT